MMSEANKHTPEPWMNLNGEETIYTRLNDGCRGMPVARVISLDTRYRANAKRIVECVNAMAGIENPQKYMNIVAGYAPSLVAFTQELKAIRKSINADENESTFDEVNRMKARMDEAVDLLRLCKARFEVKSDVLKSPTIIARIDEHLQKYRP